MPRTIKHPERSPAILFILVEIASTEEPYQSKIARQLGKNPDSITDYLRTLEAEGWVERKGEEGTRKRPYKIHPDEIWKSSRFYHWLEQNSAFEEELLLENLSSTLMKDLEFFHHPVDDTSGYPPELDDVESEQDQPTFKDIEERDWESFPSVGAITLDELLKETVDHIMYVNTVVDYLREEKGVEFPFTIKVRSTSRARRHLKTYFRTFPFIDQGRDSAPSNRHEPNYSDED